MENLEDVLMELNKFEKRPRAETDKGEGDDAIPPLLEEYLISVARCGTTHFPWPKIKPLLRAKLRRVIGEFHAFSPSDDLPAVPNVDRFDFSACCEKVFQQLDCFGGIPFTVQRLCELLTAPKKHYRRTDKFMRALEKNMLVVSTVDHRPPAESPTPPPAPLAPPSASRMRLVNGDHRREEETSGENGEDEVEAKGEPEKPSSRVSQSGQSAESSDKEPESVTLAESSDKEPESASQAESSSSEMDVDEQEEAEERQQQQQGPCDSRVEISETQSSADGPEQQPQHSRLEPSASTEEDQQRQQPPAEQGPCDSGEADKEDFSSLPAATSTASEGDNESAGETHLAI